MSSEIRVIELFAGVGGFRLGLEGHPDKKWKKEPAGRFKTAWANQWEPGSDRRQFAARCYEERFGKESHLCNRDIVAVLDAAEAGEYTMPDADLVCGGFPCQDYSVAKTLSKAGGIEGKKGVLWWQILRVIDYIEATYGHKPQYLLLENVDRLLKSPASQRGRDFAIMLSCLDARGYSIEWRVINAAEYGMPQKRRRVYIYAEQTDEKWDKEKRLVSTGVIPEAFHVLPDVENSDEFPIPNDLIKISDEFGVGRKISRFQNAGIMQDGAVYTAKVASSYEGRHKHLRGVLVPEDRVPERFYVDEDKIQQWKDLKNSKSIKRVSKTGFSYTYSEGSMAFPDSISKEARTILTGEGGTTPSRFKHIIRTKDGRYRRLVPDELDQLQMFPKGWTDTGMTDGNRAFCMGNALVVGIPHEIGKAIDKRWNMQGCGSR